MSGKIATVIVGATGYVGGELLRLVATHPVLELHAAVSSSRAGEAIADLFPGLANAYPDAAFSTLESALEGLAKGDRLAVFSAAPHAASAAVVAALLSGAAERDLEAHAVDVSADFRYPSAEAFETVYGSAHPEPGLLSEFSCAVPEHVKGTPSPHIGHPGCFATAMLLAGVPLYTSGQVASPLLVTGITGSTGSGRSPSAGRSVRRADRPKGSR